MEILEMIFVSLKLMDKQKLEDYNMLYNIKYYANKPGLSLLIKTNKILKITNYNFKTKSLLFQHVMPQESDMAIIKILCFFIPSNLITLYFINYIYLIVFYKYIRWKQDNPN